MTWCSVPGASNLGCLDIINLISFPLICQVNSETTSPLPGSFQHGGGKVLACPAPIPVKEVQEVIIEKLSKAIAAYETGSIDDIALMQAKALNRFHEKKAMAKAKTI